MLINPNTDGVPVFESFPKIPRLETNGVVITEKIDGTNAQLFISNGTILAGSRSRWLYPASLSGNKGSDNFGFAEWVHQNTCDLLKLGDGRHFGEWWGLGVNRGYGIAEKRFTIFNSSRPAETLPSCVSQVPILYNGEYSTDALSNAVDRLKSNGSIVSPGFMNPEGVVVYFFHTRQNFKYILSGGKVSKELRRVDEKLPGE